MPKPGSKEFERHRLTSVQVGYTRNKVLANSLDLESRPDQAGPFHHGRAEFILAGTIALRLGCSNGVSRQLGTGGCSGDAGAKSHAETRVDSPVPRGTVCRAGNAAIRAV